MRTEIKESTFVCYFPHVYNVPWYLTIHDQNLMYKYSSEELPKATVRSIHEYQGALSFLCPAAFACSLVSSTLNDRNNVCILGGHVVLSLSAILMGHLPCTGGTCFPFSRCRSRGVVAPTPTRRGCSAGRIWWWPPAASAAPASWSGLASANCGRDNASRDFSDRWRTHRGSDGLGSRREGFCDCPCASCFVKCLCSGAWSAG